MITTLDETLVRDLAERVSGPVLSPHDAGYDDARASTTDSSTSGPRSSRSAAATADISDAVRVRDRSWASDVRSRRRPQRRRPRRRRRRRDDRPGRDAQCRRQSGDADGARGGRRDLEGSQSRNAAVRPRDDRRRGVIDRRRRPDTGRGLRVADVEVRHGRRQPLAVEIVLADGRCVQRQRDVARRPVLGRPRRRRQLRRRRAFDFKLHAVGPMVTGGLVAWPIAAAPRRDAILQGLHREAQTTCSRRARLLTRPDGPAPSSLECRLLHGPAGRRGSASRADQAFGTPVLDARSAPSRTRCSTGCSTPRFPKGALNYWKAPFTRGWTIARSTPR